MVKRKYEPMEDVLDATVSLWQAACALEEAAKIALDTKDVDSLIRISDGWVAVAQNLLTELPSEEDNDEEVHETQPIRIGFANGGTDPDSES